MIATTRARTAQVTTAVDALAVAMERFGCHLCATGIIGRRFTPRPIDLDHVDKALAFLSRCKRTKKAATHTFDLRRAIGGDVSVGAVIAAAVALGFEAHGHIDWHGYTPHAMTNVAMGN